MPVALRFLVAMLLRNDKIQSSRFDTGTRECLVTKYSADTEGGGQPVMPAVCSGGVYFLISGTVWGY